jgi:hypothetical protein
VRKRLLVLAAAVGAGVVVVQRSIQDQRAERDLWAEATEQPASPAPTAPPVGEQPPK